MTSIDQTVRGVLARYVRCLPSTLHRQQLLERDLDVTPLEMVNVVLELEDILDASLPIDEVGSLQTVGDLIAFVSHVVARAKPPGSPRGIS
jgi:acyl carrier protein